MNRLFLLSVVLLTAACAAPRPGDGCRLGDPFFCRDEKTSVLCSSAFGDAGPGQYFDQECRNCQVSLGGSVTCGPFLADGGLP